MRDLWRAELLTEGEKNLIAYELLESTVLNFRACARLSRDELRKQSEEVAERLDELKQDLGEEYVTSLKQRLRSLWSRRVSTTTEDKERVESRARRKGPLAVS